MKHFPLRQEPLFTGYPFFFNQPIWPTLLVASCLVSLRLQLTALFMLFSLAMLPRGDCDVKVVVIVLTTVVANVALWKMLGDTLGPVFNWSTVARQRAATLRMEYALQLGNTVAAVWSQLGTLQARSTGTAALTAKPSLAHQSRRMWRGFRTRRTTTKSAGTGSTSDGGDDQPDADIKSFAINIQHKTDSQAIRQAPRQILGFLFLAGSA